MKTCTNCLREKDLSEFYGPYAKGSDTWCKECRKAAARERWSAMTPEQRGLQAASRWVRALAQRFKLSLDEYQAMYQAQEGRCRICKRSIEDIDSPRFRHLGVDHDRRCCSGPTSCGRCVRGLLCTKCNGSLGWFEQFTSEILAYTEKVEVAA